MKGTWGLIGGLELKFRWINGCLSVLMNYKNWF